MKDVAVTWEEFRGNLVAFFTHPIGMLIGIFMLLVVLRMMFRGK
jgi:hypothetical protein